jgi:FAD-linked sulfhydryl oxidase
MSAPDSSPHSQEQTNLNQQNPEQQNSEQEQNLQEQKIEQIQQIEQSMQQQTPIRMPPQIWGPILWSTLHIASLAYSDTPTERQKTNMKNFYVSMIDVLPCPVCRHHYEMNLKSYPIEPALESRMLLILWVFNMHNKINVQLGKREITFDEFIESMKNLENAKKSVPPSFHENNKPKGSNLLNLTDFTVVDMILLGSGTTLIAGASLYYLYQEVLRKSAK